MRTLASYFLTGIDALSKDERQEYFLIALFIFFSQFFLFSFVSSIVIFFIGQGATLAEVSAAMATYYLCLRAGRIVFAPVAKFFSSGIGSALLITSISFTLVLLIFGFQRQLTIGVLGISVSLLNATSRVYFHDWIAASSISAVDFFANRAVLSNAATIVAPIISVWAATQGGWTYSTALFSAVLAFAVPFALMSAYEPPARLGGSSGSDSLIPGDREIGRARALALYLLRHTIFWTAYSGLFIVIPAYFELVGWTTTSYSLLVSANGVLVVLLQGVVSGSTLSRRWISPATFYTFAMGLMAMGYAALFSLPIWPAIATFLIAYTLAELIYVPRGEAIIGDLKRRGYDTGWLVSAQGGAMGIAELFCSLVGLKLLVYFSI